MKRCYKCTVEKPSEMFSKSNTTKDRLQAQCKACDRSYYEENRKRVLKRTRQYRADNIEKVRDCTNHSHKKYCRNNRAKRKQTSRVSWLRRYGLELKDFDRMVEVQNNQCNICHREFNRTPCVDHCHYTDRVRGLLCRNCNTMLGWYENRREEILKHLE